LENIDNNPGVKTHIAESLGVTSTTFTQCAPKATEFGEITQNMGHYYAVQGRRVGYQSKAHNMTSY